MRVLARLISVFVLALLCCSWCSVFAQSAGNANTNLADELNRLRSQVEEQGRKLDRLYRALGPQLAEMEAHSPALDTARTEDGALILHEVLRVTNGLFTSKLMFLPVSRRLAVALGDGSIQLLALPAGNVLTTLPSPEKGIECLGVSSDGKRIFAGTSQGAVFLWADGKKTATKIFDTKGWPVTALAVSQDGTDVVWASNGKAGPDQKWMQPEESLAAVAVSSGKKLWSGKAGRADFQAVSYDGSGKTVAAVRTGSVLLLDAATGRMRAELAHPDYPSGPIATALSRDGLFCAVGYAPNSIGLWNAGDGRFLRLLKAHSNWVVSVAFSPDDAFLAASAGDGTASVWETITGIERGRVRFGEGDPYVRSVSISDDGRWLAAGRAGEFVVVEMPPKLSTK